jgi:anti-sigma factor RsiW
MNEHDTDLIGAYVLDALPPDEMAACEAHLEGCSTCRDEVALLHQVVSVLPLAVEAVAPPPALRDRLMSAIAAEEQEPVPAAEVVPRSGLTSLPGGAPRPRRGFRPPLAPTFAALAAAVLIAALGIQDLRLQQRVDNQNQTSALQQQVTVALASGATESRIPGTKSAPGASATLIQPLHASSAYFLVKGLKASPANRIYQIWLIKTGKQGLQPRSAGTFTYSGSGATIVKVPMSAHGYPLAGVTLEQCPNGCATPHGQMYLAGKVSV